MEDKKAQSLQTLRDLLTKITKDPDIDIRDIICTPCAGRYEEVAAWVIAVNGSPPRGVFYVPMDNDNGGVFIYQGRSRPVRFRCLKSFKQECEYTILDRFVRYWLRSASRSIHDASVIMIPGINSEDTYIERMAAERTRRKLEEQLTL